MLAKAVKAAHWKIEKITLANVLLWRGGTLHAAHATVLRSTRCRMHTNAICNNTRYPTNV